MRIYVVKAVIHHRELPEGTQGCFSNAFIVEGNNITNTVISKCEGEWGEGEKD